MIIDRDMLEKAALDNKDGNCLIGVVRYGDELVWVSVGLDAELKGLEDAAKDIAMAVKVHVRHRGESNAKIK